MGWVSIALLACAVAVLIGAEWPRLAARVGPDARRQRERARRKANLRVLSGDEDESAAFAREVERDLSRLPTIEERDRQ